MTDTSDLLERAAIHDVLLRYCRGVDRGDLDLVRSCYHPGAIDDHGSFYGASADFVGSVCGPTFEHYASMMHYLMNEIIDLTGPDVAETETYFIAYMRRVDDDDDMVLESLGGRYVDRFERRAGNWRIAHRIVVYEWSDRKTPGRGFPPEIGAFEHGHRHDADVAYTRRSKRPGR